MKGVFTADPNVVASAQKLDTLRYDELDLLARNGAQVMHPAVLKNDFSIPIHLRNTFNHTQVGTIISVNGAVPEEDEKTGDLKMPEIKPEDVALVPPRILGVLGAKPTEIGGTFQVNIVGSSLQDLDKLRDARKQLIEKALSKLETQCKMVEVEPETGGSEPWIKLEVDTEFDMNRLLLEVHESIEKHGMFQKILARS